MPAVHGDLMTPVFNTDVEIPDTIYPRQVTLRDRVTIATLIPFASPDEVPQSLLEYLSDQLNKEIEKGDTYAMDDPIPFDHFGMYWFNSFGAVMLLGDIKSVEEVHHMDQTGANWSKICLGSFNIRPNYPGRSSHVCNGMFIVTEAARNKGVGRLMGEGYLEWAPRLGYTYAVFNLVYESNVASCRLWDALGFKRIGRVPGGGRLLSHPGEFVDAIIYGRALNLEGIESITQERFDKIRYYLKHSKYPKGADRAEKSRLRSAAIHYKLLGGVDGEPERLMLKDKEVVSDPQEQYVIAQDIHMQNHAGINKTTGAIAVKYHWVRIKETVSRVIRDCPQCKETLKAPTSLNNNNNSSSSSSSSNSHSNSNNNNGNGLKGEGQLDPDIKPPDLQEKSEPNINPQGILGTRLLMDGPSMESHTQSHNDFTHAHASVVHNPVDNLGDYHMPLDPQMIDINTHLPRFQHHDAMVDPYSHDAHALHHSNFDDEVRQHTANDYQIMVDDTTEADGRTTLRPETLGLVNAQPHDLQVEQEILNKYPYDTRPEDDLDFT